MNAENKVIRPGPDGWTPALLAPAADALRRGETVVFPTETVFGFGAVGSGDESRRTVNERKGRPADQQVPLHLSSVTSIEEHAAPLSPLAHRLVDAFLPGPLTLLLETAEGDEVAIRVPDHPGATTLIREAGGVVVATAAHREGEAAAVDLATVDPALIESSAFVLDDPSETTGKQSTIVKPRGVVPEIVREGAVPTEHVQALAGPVVLLVCTGNTCRSPMASVILRRRLDEAIATTRTLPAPQIWSAGTGALGGEPASTNAIAVARERGLDLNDHRSSRLSPAAVMGADFILTMTASAAAVITDYFPELAPRVTILNGDSGGVPDPFGGNLTEYRRAADAITAALDRFIARHRATFEA